MRSLESQSRPAGGHARLVAAAMAMLACSAMPASVSAVAVAFSTSVECNAGAGIVARGGAVPASSCSESFAIPGDDGFGISSDARAEVSWGVKKVGVDGEATVGAGGTVPAGSYHAVGEASGSVLEGFMLQALDAGGAAVSQGTMVVTLLLQGLMSTSVIEGGAPGATSALSYEVQVGSLAPRSDTIEIASPPATNARTVAIPLSLVVPWQHDVPVPFSMEASTRVYAAVGTEGAAQAQTRFLNSVDWMGITDVVDADGVPVASFTALTAHGVDMATAVPVPTLLPGHALALAALVVWRRRR